jgi:hydroxymethylglutaryl-CoA lyase
MQGIHAFIPTEKKIEYLQQLISVGFDVLDAGSFVSAKAIPQLSDSKEVFSALDLSNTQTRLLAIVANTRGAEEATQWANISFLGFPLSVSETFQQRNTNKSIHEAFDAVQQIQALATQTGKSLVVYLSMGFGNPYGDPYSPDLLVEFTEKLSRLGIPIVSLADTVGMAQPSEIGTACKTLLSAFPEMEIGVHLHARPEGAAAKIQAAFDAGCRRFDGALGGIGGCPMAGDALVGNMATETILSIFTTKLHALDHEAYAKAQSLSQKLFSQYN